MSSSNKQTNQDVEYPRQPTAKESAESFKRVLKQYALTLQLLGDR